MGHDANPVQETVRISVLLPRELHERLTKQAEQEERTFSGQLRLIVAQHLEERAAA